MSKDWVKDVAQFHKHIDYTICYVPSVSFYLAERSEQRLAHMKEELHEYELGFRANDLIEMADGLADLIYLAIGTALLHGIDLRTVMDEVHKANMTKTKDPHAVKHCIKGPDYKKANIPVALYDGDLSDV